MQISRSAFDIVQGLVMVRIRASLKSFLVLVLFLNLESKLSRQNLLGEHQIVTN